METVIHSMILMMLFVGGLTLTGWTRILKYIFFVGLVSIPLVLILWFLFKTVIGG